ncbi:MAG: hypothetical protein LBM66_01250 [Bifidobacteriaceae bacterium]|jgi:hypothetical protein|nr:hypothetical protein [Bifidobacteriaceae bacterium]
MGRRSRRAQRALEAKPLDVARARGGFAMRQSAGDGDWMVRPAGPAAKRYTCPGCGRTIEPGMDNVTVWEADSLLGPEVGMELRRHWHTACWYARARRH